MSGNTDRSAVAVVGMACRLPGAATPEQFWRNLRDGVESIRTLSRDELFDAGASAADLANPKHVPAAATLEGMDLFDAGFFGFTAREAELMDPQHRVFLECAWEALEDAGCDPARFDGAIGVFGGGIFNSYVTWNLLPAGVFDDKAGILQTVLANEKDYMTARVAYKLNLRGPAYNVQTGCSTSLVAIHLACQSLLNFESDMALAGGVAIDVARRQGYFHHDGSVYSPDGHCRAFDAEARGTVFGNGAGIVALKRLDDALADGDTIHAIVLGSATNNDGSLKVGFTAPSVAGQSQVIAEALADAGVEPRTIGYVEAHGTGTALGDPIEIQALTRAFAGDRRRGACGLGSVKTNIGHLDAAAGVSGFIKTVLALAHREIPPTLHFRSANPQLELTRTPFHVVSRLLPWTEGAMPGVPRRAGVSSYGMGGTNAHVVLEAAPEPAAPAPSRPYQLLVLSARSADRLDAASDRLAGHLRARPSLTLADAAHTLQVGRAVFQHRRIVVSRDGSEAADALDARDPRLTKTGAFAGQPPRIGFMFPGQGAQYGGMARRLYEAEPLFRREIDACAAMLKPDVDLIAVLHASPESPDVTRTDIAQPALFAVEYALARLWEHWGVVPEALIGHSVGEYVAACLAGVFTLEKALPLVAARGRLMQQLPGGAMSAVRLAPEALPLAGSGVELAVVNAPSLSVVSGSSDAVEAFEGRLRASGIECRRLRTSHAFHSAAMDPVIESFTALVRSADPRTPQRRVVSNLTGTWLTDAEATSPEYWAQHLRRPVLFADGVRTLLAGGIDFLIETGPGRTLGTLARAQSATVSVTASLPGAVEAAEDHAVLLQALGETWIAGAPLDWARFSAGERRRRVPLPTYPFERSRHWIEPDEEATERRRARTRAAEKNPTVSEWCYVPCWTQTPPLNAGAAAPADGPWLVFADGSVECRRIVDLIASVCGDSALVTVTPGDAFGVSGERHFTVGVDRPEDYVRLLAAVTARYGTPTRTVHAWNAAAPDASLSRFGIRQRAFYSVAHLAAAMAQQAGAGARVLKVVTSAVDDVLGIEPLVPDRAVAAGLCLVIPQEHPQVRCERIDLTAATWGGGDDRALLAELLADRTDTLVAIRAGRRWTRTVEQLPAPDADALPPLRQQGHYLVTGGFGTIGFSLACYVASAAKARITLIGRTPLPPRSDWQAWIDAHGPNDGVSQRITRMRWLERLGAEVQALEADVSSPIELAHAVAAAERTFGEVHGVISSAGNVDDNAFARLGALRADTCERQFSAKLNGLPALAAAFEDRTPDFRIVVSSLSSVLGGVGYGAYAAANAYQDAFVASRNRSGGNWIAINWDAWHPLGGVLASGSVLSRLAMTPAEGAEAFGAVLKCGGAAQVFVSTADLEARLGQWAELQPPTEAADSPLQETDENGIDATPDGDAHLQSATPTERVVLAIWERVLGISHVEVHDAFFDLGGSSLTAIQVLDAIERDLGVKVRIEEFIFQTAAQLAALCDARRETLTLSAVATGAPAASGRRL